MLASTSVLRYYIYLSDDESKIKPMLEALGSLGFQYLKSPDLLREPVPDGQGQVFFELQQDKSRILIVQISGAQILISEALDELAQMESGCLAAEELLGQVTVLLSSELPWIELIKDIPDHSGNQGGEPLPMQAGHMSRYTPLPHHIFYACRPDHYNQTAARLATYGLPLIEARYIELQMISKLMRERSRIMTRELNDLERKHSQIMHSHLVKDQNGLKQVEELEEQVQSLSAAYGMTAANISLVNDGRLRLEDSLVKFQSRLGREPALKLEQYQLDNIVQPFTKTLKQMNNLHEMLVASRDSHQAGIDVVRSRIDIMNSRSNIATQEKIRQLMELNTSIQKQGLAFQFAAGLIEFVLLAYYSHSLWKNLAHGAYMAIPPSVQFVAVILFSGLTTYLTHVLAEYLQGDQHQKKKVIIAGIPLFLLFLLILTGTVFFSSGAH